MVYCSVTDLVYFEALHADSDRTNTITKALGVFIEKDVPRRMQDFSI